MYLTLVLKELQTNTTYTKSMILINSECQIGYCSEKSIYSSEYLRKLAELDKKDDDDKEVEALPDTKFNPRRYFNITDSETKRIDLELLSKIAGSNSYLIAAIDIDEDGRLDFIIQQYDQG